MKAEMRASTAPQIKRNGLTFLQNILIKAEANKLSPSNVKIKTDIEQYTFFLIERYLIFFSKLFP